VGDVVAAFEAAGLPAANPRDNSGNCVSDGERWCEELVTTDDIGVYRFADERAAKAAAGKDLGAQIGTMVLSYTGANTPKKLQPKYARVATDAQS
jgi:hypothetical protein